MFLKMLPSMLRRIEEGGIAFLERQLHVMFGEIVDELLAVLTSVKRTSVALETQSLMLGGRRQTYIEGKARRAVGPMLVQLSAAEPSVVLKLSTLLVEPLKTPVVTLITAALPELKPTLLA